MKSRVTLLIGLFIFAAGVILLFYLYNHFAHESPPKMETGVGTINENERSANGLFPVEGLEITEFEYWVSIQEDIWWRYAYRLRLRNNSDGEQTVRADIRYYDPDGTVIDSTTTNALTVPPGEEKSFTGHSLISVPGARRVEDAEVVIRKSFHVK